jgi:uncharacterized protein (DUF58 family)
MSFLAAVPVLLLFFVFTPLRPVQFISLFLIVLILGSKAYSEYLARHLRFVRRDRELRAFRYQWTDVELRVENAGWLPAFLLALSDSSGGVAVYRNIKCLCTLGGKSRQLFRWEAYGSARGVFTLGPAALRGSDPLGLFPFSLSGGETTKLFVYPAPAYAAIGSPGGVPLGNLLTSRPFNEDLTRPRSLRDYSPGDESRRINWKASAKNSGLGTGEKLLVNEYELSLSYPLALFLNVDTREYAIKNREMYIERVIEAAAAVCLMAARDRQALGLILHARGREDNSLISPAAFTLIPVLERLAALEPFKTGEPESGGSYTQDGPALRLSTRRLLEKGKALPFGTRLIYAGPPLPEEDYRALESLKRRRLSLEYLIIDEKYLGAANGRHQIKETGYVLL